MRLGTVPHVPVPICHPCLGTRHGSPGAAPLCTLAVLAVTWDALDLDGAVVEVRGTVIRRPGRAGLHIQSKPKTKTGWRTLHLPDWLVVLLRAREREEDEWNVVFPSQLGKLRDRSNTNADLRAALDPLGLGWVTSHTFRKTAATLLNDGGLTVREVADQLGHSRVASPRTCTSAAVVVPVEPRMSLARSRTTPRKVWVKCGVDHEVRSTPASDLG